CTHLFGAGAPVRRVVDEICGRHTRLHQCSGLARGESVDVQCAGQGSVSLRPGQRVVSIVLECLLWANSGLRAVQQTASYSITSSARASSVGGTSRLSAFAVLRLITSSNLVGACTGRSAAFSPLRMRPT